MIKHVTDVRIKQQSGAFMTEVLCFDLSAFAILAILFITMKFSGSSNDRASKRLTALVLVTMAAAISDIASTVCNGDSERLLFNYICTGIHFVSRNMAYFLYASYIVAVTGTWHKVNKKSIRSLKYIPLLVIVLVAITAPSTKLFYFYNANYYYVRGKFFVIIYLCSAIYTVVALYYIFTNVSIIGRRKTISLASCAFVSIITSFIQYERPYLAVDVIGFTLSILFIALFVDNPEEKIEQNSKLLKYQVYAKDLKTSFHTSRPFDVIHINICNAHSIEEMLSYSNHVEFERRLSKKLQDINDLNNLDGSLYYIKDGKFRIILEGNDYNRSMTIAKILCTAFNGQVRVNNFEVTIETSIHLTQCPQDFSSQETLLGFSPTAINYDIPGEITLTADIIAKDNYSISSNIDKIIESAIVGGRLDVYYQPIYNVKTGTYTGAEAFLRLLDDEKGMILPGVIVPESEQNGSIMEIDMFVIREVCKFIASDDFKKTDLDSISCNISVIHCMQKGMPKRIMSVIEEYNVDPKKLRFEIRESIAAENQKIYKDNIKELADYGIQFILDDFGTGYSNITTFTSLPVEMIKFDKEFTNTHGNEKLDVIVENSINLVKSLEKRITIKGVETDVFSEKYRKLGCDFMQGFYYQKPMPKDELMEFYAKG